MPETDYSKYGGHTPGPWKHNPEYIGIHPCPRDGPFDMIAAVCSCTEAADANGRLIADAPFLLARCQKLEAKNKKLETDIEELENEVHFLLHSEKRNDR